MPLPDSDDYALLAGNLNDYTPVVDPTTDLPDVASNTTRADVAGMSRLIDRAFVKWTNNGTTATIVNFDSVVGNDVSLRPVITKLGTGHWRFTWAPSLTNLLGQEAFWSFRDGHGAAAHNEPIHVQVKRIAPNIMDVYMWALPAATANDVGGVELTLWVM